MDEEMDKVLYRELALVVLSPGAWQMSSRLDYVVADAFGVKICGVCTLYLPRMTAQFTRRICVDVDACEAAQLR